MSYYCVREHTDFRMSDCIAFGIRFLAVSERLHRILEKLVYDQLPRQDCISYMYVIIATELKSASTDDT